MTCSKALLVSLGLAVVTFAEKPARADEAASQRCAAAYEKAQVERKKGSFLEATQAAQACSQIECQDFVVQECIKLLEQFRNETPTLVFSARNGRGEEIANVNVEMDGKPLVDHIDGMAVPVDPGLHTFVFKTTGQDPVELKHTARVGDKNRLLEVQLGKPEPVPAASGVVGVAPAPVVAEAPPKKGVPVASYVLGGIGVVGLGAFTYLRLKASSDYNDLSNTCSPRCSPDDVDKVHSKYQMSWVGLGVGVAGLGSAALVYILSRNSESAPSSQVAVIPAPGGARALWSTRF